MSRRQYFINHSIRNENNDSNNTNETDDIQITNNRYELEMAASQLSNNTRISQDNYQPIYPDNLQVDQPGISSTNSQVVQAYISPQIIQVPALAHSPQTRSVISGPYINNGDYVVVDQGSNTDNLINYNPNHSSLILTNGNSLHATRSLANRHRKYSGGGHSPVITGVTSYNSSRYSVNGSIYNTVNNRHSIGVYSIANSIITNHSGNTFNYGIRDEVGNSQSHSERNRHEDDSNDFITTNTSTSHNHNHNNNNNNSNNNTNDNTNNDSNEYNNLRSKVPSPLNLDSSSHYSNENKINSFNSNTNSSPLLSSKNLNDSNDFIISADVLDESTCINEDRIHRYNEHEIDDHIMASAIKNGDIHSKIGKNKMSDTEEGSSISMSLSISSKKLNYDSNNENENEGGVSTYLNDNNRSNDLSDDDNNRNNDKSDNDNNRNNDISEEENNNRNNNRNNDISYDNNFNNSNSDGNNDINEDIVKNGSLESNDSINKGNIRSQGSLSLHSEEENEEEAVKSTNATTPNASANNSNEQKLTKEELVKRERSYIKAHKRKIPVLVDKHHHSLRINTVSGSSSGHKRRVSAPYSQHHLSLNSNRNSLSMTNLVQLNSHHNSYVGTNSALPQNVNNNSNDLYLYEASSSSNGYVQPRNNIIYRNDSNYHPKHRESNRSKHLSIISLPKNNHATFYIADETSNSTGYSGSFTHKNSLSPTSPIIISPIATNSPSRNSTVQHQSNVNDYQQLQGDIQSSRSINNDVSVISSNHSRSFTNISNLLHIANDENDENPISANPTNFDPDRKFPLDFDNKSNNNNSNNNNDDSNNNNNDSTNNNNINNNSNNNNSNRDRKSVV